MELTKLTNQLSAKMSADSKAYSCPERRAIAASYLGKGPVGTLFNIVQKRGPAGLYTGFPLHLGMSLSSLYMLSLPMVASY